MPGTMFRNPDRPSGSEPHALETVARQQPEARTAQRSIDGHTARGTSANGESTGGEGLAIDGCHEHEIVKVLDVGLRSDMQIRAPLPGGGDDTLVAECDRDSGGSRTDVEIDGEYTSDHRFRIPQ